MNRLRRRFLLGRFSEQSDGLLPPWTRRDIDFTSMCSQCGECIATCPEGLLHASESGYPQPNFEKGGCIFCGDCARACTLPIFYKDLNTPAWQQVIHIESTCLAYSRITCQSCQDGCEVGAIKFKYIAGSSSLPNVDTAKCTGCGMCIQVCPTKAITMIRF